MICEEKLFRFDDLEFPKAEIVPFGTLVRQPPSVLAVRGSNSMVSAKCLPYHCESG